MPSPTRPRRPGPFALAGAFALLAAVATARGDLFILKDGTVLQGKVRREGKVEVDPASHEAYILQSGVYYIDDGPRRMFFPKDRLGNLVPEDKAPSELAYGNPEPFVTRGRVPPIIGVLETTEWDSDWKRQIRVSTYEGSPKLHQRLSLLTPRYARVDGSKLTWTSYYLTGELGPEVVKGLLEHRPKPPAVKGKPPTEPRPEDEPARRLRQCEFFAQAGWFDESAKGLDSLAKDFPAERDKVEAARDVLARVRARERLEQAKRRRAAGQYETCRRLLADFPEAGAAEQVLTEVRDIRGALEGTVSRLAAARAQLAALGRELKTAESPTALRDGVAALVAELHPDLLPRLEAYLGQAAQAERQRKDGRKPTATPEQLAGLAVTGWLLGNASAEPRPEAALRLWRARGLVLAYLRADDEEEKRKLLDDYLADKAGAARIDEFCQLIPLLPPAQPEGDLGPVPAELRAGKRRHAPIYQLQLPPEYTHSRPHPVLIALGAAGEKASRTIQRWGELAAENGFLLAAVEWEQEESGGRYTFSEREHAAVLETLRDLRRRFAVDSDRVFLTGVAQGAAMAFDVGLSHPDLFAGLIPISGGPSFFSAAYWRNAQYLPVYAVTGDHSGDSNTQTRKQFDSWVLRGYPVLWVQYKGRGVEWFPGELPAIFDWMREKRRAWPLHQLGSDGSGTGFGNEFTILRPGDNRFYWLTADDVSDRCCTTLDAWKAGILPATLTGRIDPTINEVFISAKGVKRLTLWLGRNARGENMIDFEKPLTVRVNLGGRVAGRKVTPSLETLLNDLAARGDRQRLFLVQIPLKP